MKNYLIQLRVFERDTVLTVDYETSDFAIAAKDDMRASIELLVKQVAAANSQMIEYDYIDDIDDDVTISCKIDYEVPLSKVGQVMELIEQVLIETPKR